MSRRSDETEKIAARSLQNQLDLAVQLLKIAKQGRDTVLREDEVIESAREAFRHSMNALARLPELPDRDMARVERAAAEFRSVLSELVPNRTCRS